MDRIYKAVSNDVCYYNSKDSHGHKINKGDVVVIMDIVVGSVLICKKHALEYLEHEIQKCNELIKQIEDFNIHDK